MRLNIKNIVAKNKFVVAVFIVAAFLRLYNLYDFTTFLSDQGRDAIIVRQIATLTHLTAIGPTSSLGGVFLGPFFYYLMAPFLLLANFNPIGMTLATSLFSILGIGLAYIMVRKETNPKIALIYLVLATFSYVNIDLSRFAWNPNLLPIFAFVTLYFFYKFIQTNKNVYSFLFGILFGLSIQLHYLAIFLVFPMFIVFIQKLITQQKIREKINTVKTSLFSLIGFFFVSWPLIYFDIKHQFVNTQSFLRLFGQDKLVSGNSSFLSKFIDTNQSFFVPVFNSNINGNLAFILLLFMVIATIFLWRSKKINIFSEIHLLNLFSFIFAFSFLFLFRHPHYYGPIYYSFFFLLAYLAFYIIPKNIIGNGFLTLLLLLYIVVNAKSINFLSGPGNKQIQHSQNVANFLSDKIGNKPFNIATWPIEFGEDNFVYFLEVKGLIPADRTKLEITKQLFVLCNQEPCLVLNSPSWNISMFGKAKIAEKWEIEGVKIYKLVHQ